MKQWKFTLSICVAAIFASCSKDNSIVDQSSGDLRMATVSPKESAVVSDWESGYGWNLGDSSNYKLYAHNRATPEITSDIINTGAVLIWAKNVPTDEGGITSKPQQLPFAVIRDLGRPAYNNYWYYMTSVGNATVKFRTNKFQYTQDPAPLPNANIQFRYFIIPKAELDQYGHTPATIARITYDQLVSLLGTGQ